MELELRINVDGRAKTRLTSLIIAPDNISETTLMEEITKRRNELAKKKKSILSKRGIVAIDSARPSTRIFKRMLTFSDEG